MQIIKKIENSMELLSEVMSVIGKYKRESTDIAGKLTGENLKERCKEVFNTCSLLGISKDEKQVIQLYTPARSWQEDSVSLVSAVICLSSILCCAGISHYLVLAKFRENADFTHIYIKVPKYQGASISVRSQYIALDLNIGQFNIESIGIREKYHKNVI